MGDWWTDNGFTPQNGYTVVKDSSGSGWASTGGLDKLKKSVSDAFGSLVAPPKMNSQGQVINISSWGSGVAQQAIPATPTTITPNMTNPVQNQFKYLMDMSNGVDEFGNPVTAGQRAWAKDQLKQYYGLGGAVAPTAQPTPTVQGPTPTDSNGLLPSTGGVGGMMDKIAPVFVLLILVKIISGVGGLFRK